jgi:AAA family ATP:ADP antiporter
LNVDELPAIAPKQSAIAPWRSRLRAHPLEFLLRLFGDVRPGEAPTVLLLTLYVFLLLTAYYLVKVAREPLILLGGGAEVKSYASVGQSIILVFVANAYGWLAARVSRIQLIGYLTLFFAADLLVFAALGRTRIPLGIPFFLWVGIFNIVTVAQFWSFAADTYSEEQGKRLFPIIGIGSSLGAVSGAMLAGPIVGRSSPFTLMIVASAVLLSTFALARAVHRREAGSMGKARAREDRFDEPMKRGNAFALVARDRYLLLLAALIFILNVITKTGDYVLDRMLIAQAHAHAGSITPTAYIGEFKARYFEWINILEVILQSFVVSRVIKYAGIRAALVFVPLASLTGYASALVVPALGVLLVTRVTESTLDYSLSNTARNALWLVTPREAKYKAKQVVDTFVWRAGDSVSALVVWLGVRTAARPRDFLAVNVAASILWVAIAYFAGRAYERRAAVEHGSD